MVAEPLEEIALWMERLAAGVGTQRGRRISNTLSDATDWLEAELGTPAAEPTPEAAAGEDVDERDQWRSW